ncbi:MAG: general secretion pathway protein GspM [Acidisphaera sp.]|nr:general secretion pathway protein GspM [Acidisphaera sp.]
MSAALPTGLRGRLLALGLTLALLGGLWVGVVAPLVAWHAERAEALAERGALARRMAVLAQTLPALERQQQATKASGPAPSAVLSGATDAVAGAALQGQVQDMATTAGAALTSAETLPSEPAGAYRRIGLRVSINAQWPVLVRLLTAVEQATPRMLIDDVQLHSSVVLIRAAMLPLDATFTVYALRPGAAPADQASGAAPANQASSQ